MNDDQLETIAFAENIAKKLNRKIALKKAIKKARNISDETRRRERFIAKGIPYDEIDKEMIPVIEILNFQFGLKTKFCCFGHKRFDHLYIMFDESLRFEDVENLATLAASKIKMTPPFYLSFKYWIRKVGNKVLKNWVLETSHKTSLSDRKTLLTDLMNILVNEAAYQQWLDSEQCARCGINEPYKNYSWCLQCRPDLKEEE